MRRPSDRPRRIDVAIVLAVLLLLAIVEAAGAQPLEKHSGVIADANGSAGTLVLAELGPWRVRDGRTVITYRTIAFTPATEFALAFRAEHPDSGFSGAFIETPLEPWAVYVGDHVTIECRHEGKRLVAVKMTVTDLPGADF
jgi:hypothetical protein